MQSYAIEQALCDYDHILDNLHALGPLLEATVHAGILKPIASGTFLLEPWDYHEFTDELAPQKTKATAEIIKDIDATYLALDSVEVYATESLCGTWYQKE